MSGREKALSNAGYSSAGLYIEYLFGLIASILVARALGPADLGIYSLLVWIVSTGVIVANAGITTAAIKFVAELEGSGRSDLVGALVRKLQRMQRIMLLLVGVGVSVLLYATRDHIATGLNLGLLGLISASVLLRAPYMFNIALAKGGQDFKSTAIIAGVSSTTNLAMIAVAWAWRSSLPVFVAIYAVSGVVFYLVSRSRTSAIRHMAKQSKGPLPAQLEARITHHLRVVAFTIILGSVGTSEIELPFLNLWAGSDQAGMFKVANALALGAALLAPGVLSAQLLPMMASAYGRGREEAASLIAGATAWLFVLGAPLMALGTAFSHQLIALLYGPAYAPAAEALSILLVARVTSTLGQGASAYLVSADRQTAMMKLTLIFTLLRVVGAGVGTFYFGFRGAVVSSAALAVLGTVFIVELALRETRSSLPWGRLLRIAIAAALAALCSWPAAWLQPPLLALAIGGIIFLPVYMLALWLLRCLHEADAEYARVILSRITGGRLGNKRPR
ncbi:MAG: polysaccharide biosynthesis C-terminal domain-containing protein [Pseudoxanthomonas sp.]